MLSITFVVPATHSKLHRAEAMQLGRELIQHHRRDGGSDTDTTTAGMNFVTSRNNGPVSRIAIQHLRPR